MRASFFSALILSLALPSSAVAKQKSLKLPDPGPMIFETEPPAPDGMIETGRQYLYQKIRYLNPIITRKLRNPHSLDTTASTCFIGWKVKSQKFRIPGSVRLIWSVFDKPAAARFAALSHTWGTAATPPKSSLPTGTLSGVPIGTESWHQIKKEPIRLIVYKDRILVEIDFVPPSRLNGKKVVYDRVRAQYLDLMESMTKETLGKTAAYLRSHP